MNSESRADFLIIGGGIVGLSVARQLRIAHGPSAGIVVLEKENVLGVHTPTTTSARLGQKKVSGQFNKVVRVLLDAGMIEHTIPGKPTSRLQKYRICSKCWMKRMKTEEFSKVMYKGSLILHSRDDSTAEKWAFFEAKVKEICKLMISLTLQIRIFP